RASVQRKNLNGGATQCALRFRSFDSHSDAFGAALVPRPGNVGRGWYGGGMGCYDLSPGEVYKGLGRLPGSPARDRIELAAALVGAVAGVRAQPDGLEFP